MVFILLLHELIGSVGTICDGAHICSNQSAGFRPGTRLAESFIEPWDAERYGHIDESKWPYVSRARRVVDRCEPLQMSNYWPTIRKRVPQQAIDVSADAAGNRAVSSCCDDDKY